MGVLRQLNVSSSKNVLIVAALATLCIFMVNTNGVFDSTGRNDMNRGSSAAKSTESNDGPIKTTALLGERNSGTTFVLGELKRCFGDVLDVQNHLVRHKHWFQYDNGKLHNRTLVISQFRNPYHWVAAMMEKPRHAPDHYYLDWNTFLTKPWTTKRAESDLPLKDVKGKKGDGRICKQRFRYDEIVCCKELPPRHEYLVPKKNGKLRQDTPYYETRKDGSGIPYGSVLDLRTDKILNHIHDVKAFDWVADVIIVQYEQLLTQGTALMISQIEKQAGVSAHCEATPPQPNRPKRAIDPDMLQWMNKHGNWEIEALIGYQRWNLSDIS